MSIVVSGDQLIGHATIFQPIRVRRQNVNQGIPRWFVLEYIHPFPALEDGRIIVYVSDVDPCRDSGTLSLIDIDSLISGPNDDQILGASLVIQT